MNKTIKIILIISVIVFGVGFLLINSAQAGVVWFGDKNIFVDFDGLPFNLSNWAPGMSDVKSITINNGEDFDINLYFKAQKTSGDEVLAEVLTITIDNKPNHLSDLFNNNVTLTPVNSGESQNYNIAISFDEDAGNEYQGKTINFDFVVVAEQIGEVIIPGGWGGGGGLPPGLTIVEGTVTIPEGAIGETSVTITWLTSYPSTSQVIYAAAGESYTFDLTQPNYGYPHAAPVPEDPAKVTFHSVTLTGLTPGTTYYYRTVSRASLAISREYSFTTLGGEKAEEGIPYEEEIPAEEVVLAPTGEEEIEKPSGEITEGEGEIVGPGEVEKPILAEERTLGEIFATEGLLAAIGAMPFNLKVILIIFGVIIIGLVILRLIRKRRLKKFKG